MVGWPGLGKKVPMTVLWGAWGRGLPLGEAMGDAEWWVPDMYRRKN